jgi:hypothetical protein
MRLAGSNSKKAGEHHGGLCPLAAIERDEYKGALAFMNSAMGDIAGVDPCPISSTCCAVLRMNLSRS